MLFKPFTYEVHETNKIVTLWVARSLRQLYKSAECLLQILSGTNTNLEWFIMLKITQIQLN